MSTDTHKAGIEFLRSLGRHAELIMAAFSSPSGGVTETEANTRAIEELCRHRLMQRDDQDDTVRLRTPIRHLLNQGLSSVRLRMVNANIGQSVDGIKVLVKQYIDSKKAGDSLECEGFLQDLRDNVYSLCDDMMDQSRDIWQQINSDFGVASRLASKLALNQNAINRVQQLQEALSLIDFDELYALCRRDRDLMRVVYARLRGTHEQCLQELGDAIHRLNKMLFSLRRLERRARRVTALATHLRTHLDFRVEDPTDRAEVPALFHLAPPLVPSMLADVRAEGLEVDHAQLIQGVRKEVALEEGADEGVSLLPAALTEQAVVPLEFPEFQAAIREMFCQCLEQGKPVSALLHFDPAVAGTDPGLWFFAVLSEFSAMEDRLNGRIRLDYVGEASSEFNGNFVAEDVVLCRV